MSHRKRAKIATLELGLDAVLKQDDDRSSEPDEPDKSEIGSSSGMSLEDRLDFLRNVELKEPKKEDVSVTESARYLTVIKPEPEETHPHINELPLDPDEAYNLYEGHQIKEEMVIGPTEFLKPTVIKPEPEETHPHINELPLDPDEAYNLYEGHQIKEEMVIGPTEFLKPTVIKPEPEETHPHINELPLDPDEAYNLYEGHQIKEEMVIGPTEFLKPTVNVEVTFDQTCRRDEDPILQPEVCELTFEGDHYQEPFEQINNDDDESISLFAESISGIECNSVCATASKEEFVTQPLPTNQLYNPLQYVPTKIPEEETQNIKNEIVYEKQNVDSTSTSRQHPSIVKTFPFKKTLPQEIKLIALQHKPREEVKSSVFRGVCFYNLSSNCKIKHCRFLHNEPNDTRVVKRLLPLTDQAFIEEYMLLRNWPELRRRYATIYLNQCIDRKMIRLLVEMVIDSIEQAFIEVNVIERALMELNNVDLSECEDLLQFNFGQNILLCDVLMLAIGESQNFSRFKSVFMKLTNFVVGIGRSFQLNVANQILLFVCIVPCEESLALAMLAILKNTDPKIFENPMILKFEERLLLLDDHLREELRSLKELASVVALLSV